MDPERFGLVTFNTALEKYIFKGLGIRIKVGMTPDALLSAGVAAQWLKFYRQALRDGSYVREYFTFATINYLLLSIGPLKRDGEDLGISVFGKDITERKHG